MFSFCFFFFFLVLLTLILNVIFHFKTSKRSYTIFFYKQHLFGCRMLTVTINIRSHNNISYNYSYCISLPYCQYWILVLLYLRKLVSIKNYILFTNISKKGSVASLTINCVNLHSVINRYHVRWSPFVFLTERASDIPNQ